MRRTSPGPVEPLRGPDGGAIDRIVLIGFMAAGKTTVGRLLARRLGWEFVDLDREIEARAGAAPGRIIRERGEAVFRELEAEQTGRLAGREGIVLAPGGGWASDPTLFERLGPGTARVWLDVSVAEALRRAEREPVDRPMLGEPLGRAERASRLLQARTPGYARAELKVQVDGKEPDAVAREIVRRLASNREDDER